MSDSKSGEGKGGLFGDSQESAPRARNRTVMLTPDITTQVRARLSKKVAFDEENPAAAFSQQEEQPQQSSESISLPYQEYIASEDVPADSFDQYSQDSYVVDEEPAELESPISRQVHQIESEHEVQVEEELPADPVFEEPQFFEEPEASVISKRSIMIQPVIEEPQPVQRVAEPVRLQAVVEKRVAKNTSQVTEENMATSFKIHWSKVTPIIGFFVSFDNDPAGEVLVLRSGRLLVTSEIPASGSYVHIADETVSPMHAILKVTEDSQVQLLDNLSEYGTTIIRTDSGEEVNLSGEKAMLYHGDLVKFGSRCFTLCLIKGV